MSNKPINMFKIRQLLRLGEQQETRYKKVVEKSIHNGLVKCRPFILRAGIK